MNFTDLFAHCVSALLSFSHTFRNFIAVLDRTIPVKKFQNPLIRGVKLKCVKTFIYSRQQSDVQEAVSSLIRPDSPVLMVDQSK